MEPAALAAEFFEGISRYVTLARRAQRRVLLARLQHEPSTDTLRELWSRTKKDAAAGAPKDAGSNQPEGGQKGTRKP